MTTQESITISLEEYNRLTKGYEEYKSKVEWLNHQYEEYKSKVEWLNHQLSELKRMIFGSKRERFISNTPEEQLSLFDIEKAEETTEDTKQETITYTRSKTKEKKQPLRAALPSHLPRKEEIIEPDNIPEGAKKIGEAVTEILEYTPSKIYVRKIIRPKYITESNDEQTKIKIASLPSLPIPKGNAGAGLLSYIIISKFVDHLPFYRQRQIFRRQGLDISESTINGWFRGTANLIMPLYDVSRERILKTDYLMADETPIPVLTKDKPGSTHKGYHWVYYDPVRRLVLFDYRKSRGREGPDEILKEFKGYLQVDGYSGYNNLSNGNHITLLACMAHARRKFDKALDNDKSRAEHALKLFQKLYEVERIARDEELDYEQIKQLRQEKSLPVLQDMEQWLNEEQTHVVPKSVIGQAISYTINLWPRLRRYVEQGRFSIDNNPIENSIRPVALGRKNYLFAGSHKGAENAAMFYSFFATCKINNVEPYAWLKKVLELIPDYPVNRLHELLPGILEV
jgi:transposase